MSSTSPAHLGPIPYGEVVSPNITGKSPNELDQARPPTTPPYIPSSPSCATDVGDILIGITAEQYEKEEKQNIWTDSPFKKISELESNNVGIVGENVVQKICECHSIPAKINGTLTKERGGGAGDGIIRGRSVEIKTARQGTGKCSSFQHELGEKPWKADFMLFVDVSPKGIYFTLFPNMTEEQYKMPKEKFKCPYFPTKSITWRKAQIDSSGASRYGGGAFKLDTTVKLNEKAAKLANPKTIKWTSPADDAKIVALIDNVIPASN
jgi:hypothetical protein